MPSRQPLSKTESLLKDLRLLCALPTTKKYDHMTLSEYPFDAQVLNCSRLYRESRKLYLQMGGTYTARMTSMMRGLSAQDLFVDELEFSPSFAELKWFKDHANEVSDPDIEVDALSRFNEISLFHEQNHRILWRVLPPAPTEERDLCRYLNFAESLVVMLDLALADEIGRKLSPAFERLHVIYRTSDGQNPKPGSTAIAKRTYREYLLATLCATYYILELTHPEDILKAVNYVLPGQKALNRKAVSRSLDINELFPRVTNPQWQKRYWQHARKKLKSMHAGSRAAPLYLPDDPLDLEEEFFIARGILNEYGL